MKPKKEGQSFQTPAPRGKAAWGPGVTPEAPELEPEVLEDAYAGTSAESVEIEGLTPALGEVEPLEEEKAPEHELLPEGETRPGLEEVEADTQLALNSLPRFSLPWEIRSCQL